MSKRKGRNWVIDLQEKSSQVLPLSIHQCLFLINDEKENDPTIGAISLPRLILGMELQHHSPYTCSQISLPRIEKSVFSVSSFARRINISRLLNVVFILGPTMERQGQKNTTVTPDTGAHVAWLHFAGNSLGRYRFMVS